MMKASSNNTGIGQPVQRRRDFRLLTGKGCDSDDFSFPGQAYAVMVRSPHACTRIRSIDTAATTASGLLAMLTGRNCSPTVCWRR
jgi:carbon-monoxide dehydrogenase large subunit